eukprot:1077254-Pyramimonas_sp.AAC.1
MPPGHLGLHAPPLSARERRTGCGEEGPPDPDSARPGRSTSPAALRAAVHDAGLRRCLVGEGRAREINQMRFALGPWGYWAIGL